MKIYSIGRADDCDIRYDEHENPRFMLVSGHHAILKVSWLGKYVLQDFSTNGTTVNGARIERDKDIPVNRGDTVVFGGAAELDWSKIAKPKAPMAFMLAGLLIVVVFMIFALLKCGSGKNSSTSVLTDSASSVPVQKPVRGKSDSAKTNTGGATDSKVKSDNDSDNGMSESESVADNSFLGQYLRRNQKESPKASKVRNPNRKTTEASNTPVGEVKNNKVTDTKSQTDHAVKGEKSKPKENTTVEKESEDKKKLDSKRFQ